MAKEMMSKIGIWAFILGLILAVVIALIGGSTPPTWGVITLILLGLIVGFLNISDKEMMMFLIATIGFMMALGSMSNALELIWKDLAVFFQLVTVFIAPAAFIVALKALYNIARD